MTLADRVAYCRQQIAKADDDWEVWLAEQDGLLVATGQLFEIECRNAYVTDDRLRMWFERGREDGRVLARMAKETS